MDQQLLEDTIHELTCRDRYMLTSSQVGMTIRGVYPDIPEAEVVTVFSFTAIARAVNDWGGGWVGVKSDMFARLF